MRVCRKGREAETRRDEDPERRRGRLLEIGAVRVRWDWDYEGEGRIGSKRSRGEVLWRKRALDGSLLGVAKHCTLSRSMSV